MTYDQAVANCIFRYVSGSQAYGTNRPDSDQDVRGVFMAPLEKAFELFQSRFVNSGTIGERLYLALQNVDDGESDAARENIKAAMSTEYGDLKWSVETVHHPKADEELHELRRFLKLAADCNPNIIEYLYVEKGVLATTPIWEEIRANRHLFLCRKARYTFSGYAHSQLSRIETHRSYLLSPPTHKPTREEFGLAPDSKIAKENQKAILSLPSEWVTDESKAYVKQERAYGEALDNWNSFKEWETKRNPARKELEAKYGFDVKHAMHLIRLSRMGVEIIRDGAVLVHRPDAEELKGVLRGEWSYEKVVEESQKANLQMEEFYKKSPLRDKPDHNAIAKLYVKICEARYGIKI